ncbi:MAG: 7-carboxy-7-deazaguanine synthase QueE [Pseudomonadota bacterium]
MHQLRISEIFHSLQGETNTVGVPTTFIRLTGCPLRCGYCDSEYAFSGGEMLSFDDILEKTASYQPRFVTVTGGEPLAQPNCLPLLSALCDAHYSVSIETSGALDVKDIDPRVSIVMDLKTPGSGECGQNRYVNLDHLRAKDQLKFVITSREDYDWAKEIVMERQLHQVVTDVLFSPSYEDMKPLSLANWIVEDNLPVRFQMQLHKLLWGDQPGF